MSVLFVPRSTWYVGTPTSNAGNPRPLLSRPVPYITRHYTGSPSSLRARVWAGPDFMPDFQRIALASGKSYEYNYVIPPRSDGSSQVWEYAGAYQAAHSEGENAIAIGVLFCIGVDNHPSYSWYDKTKPTVWEPITAQMIEAYRWLRDVRLKGLGLIGDETVEVEHRNMPGANTACPGLSVIAASNQLSAPYADPTPEPEEPVVRYFKLASDLLTVWGVGDDLNAVRLEQFVCDARGVNPATVPVISAAEAARYVYGVGLTAQSVK